MKKGGDGFEGKFSALQNDPSKAGKNEKHRLTTKKKTPTVE